MIVNKLLDCCLLEETSLGETRRKEMVREEFSKLSVKPVSDGDRKTAPASIEFLRWNNPRQRTLEDLLRNGFPVDSAE
jgi:hypothetical protein